MYVCMLIEAHISTAHISSCHSSSVVLFSEVLCVCNSLFMCAIYSKIAGRMESRRAIPLLVGRKCVASCSRKPSSTNLSTASQFNTCNIIHEHKRGVKNCKLRK